MQTEIWFQKYYGEMLITYANEVKFVNDIGGTEHAVVDLYLLARYTVLSRSCHGY